MIGGAGGRGVVISDCTYVQHTQKRKSKNVDVAASAANAAAAATSVAPNAKRFRSAGNLSIAEVSNCPLDEVSNLPNRLDGEHLPTCDEVAFGETATHRPFEVTGAFGASSNASFVTRPSGLK